MRAEIIAVGTELLLGDILNTNAQFLSRELATLGVTVHRQTVVGDNAQRLADALDEAFARGAELIVTSGGLGPTKDDLTKEVAASYFGYELALHEPSMDAIEKYFKKQNIPLKESNRKQALFPKEATVLANANGTAPGCLMEKGGKMILLLPGPPRELEPMFLDVVMPILKKGQSAVIVSKTLRLSGIGESQAADKLRDLLDNENPTVAPYAKNNEVHFRITAKGSDKAEAAALIEPVKAEAYSRLSAYIYGEDEQTLAQKVVELLKKHDLTVSSAESCTGGMLASAFIDVAGASAVYHEGLVTYTNGAKVGRLGVSQDTLMQYGAVSSECAAEMAEGVARTSKTGIGLSTTGVAGPDGGTNQKPVGLVYIGLWIKDQVYTKEMRFVGNRDRIRTRTVAVALNWLRITILKMYEAQ